MSDSQNQSQNQNQGQYQNQHNTQYYEEEIDIRELVMALWKKKIFIICCTLITAILAYIFSVFILSPKYETNLNIVINMPETYNTRYGEYKLHITTNEQYIGLITSNDVIINTIKDMGYSSEEMTLESLKRVISISKADKAANTEQNSFTVMVSADNPGESLRLAEALFDNYIEFLDVMIKEKAVTSFYNEYSIAIKSMEVELSSIREILKKNRELLARTPQTINQKEALNELQGQLPDTSDFVVLENVINPNYTKIESDIINNEQEINRIENTINTYKSYFDELDREKKAIAKYYETGKTEKLDSIMIGIVETNVFLSSAPVAPTQKTSPSNTRNVLIGGVLGGMLGVLFVLARKYLFSPTEQRIEGGVNG